LPWTLSSVRLKTTFGIAHLLDEEPKQLVARDRPPECALAVGDEAVHRDAHRVDQHAFTPELGIRLSFLSAGWHCHSQ
jgi:hypothetical protein